MSRLASGGSVKKGLFDMLELVLSEAQSTNCRFALESHGVLVKVFYY